MYNKYLLFHNKYYKLTLAISNNFEKKQISIIIGKNNKLFPKSYWIYWDIISMSSHYYTFCKISVIKRLMVTKLFT